MTTAAARLVSLAGTTGTAATLLLLIGSGATAGAALVNYSGLPSATAATHLLTDHAVVEDTDQGGSAVGFSSWQDPRPAKRRKQIQTLLTVGAL